MRASEMVPYAITDTTSAMNMPRTASLMSRFAVHSAQRSAMTAVVRPVSTVLATKSGSMLDEREAATEATPPTHDAAISPRVLRTSRLACRGKHAAAIRPTDSANVERMKAEDEAS